MPQPFVAILMGSDSDLPVVEAAQILAVANPELRERLLADRQSMANEVMAKDKALQEKLAKG